MEKYWKTLLNWWYVFYYYTYKCWAEPHGEVSAIPNKARRGAYHGQRKFFVIFILEESQMAQGIQERIK